MYFSNIAHDEVRQFHPVMVSNFSIKLSDALTSDLFKIETIISNKIYKIYPLFNCLTITSTNPNDKILDNRCLIVEKKTDTKLIFISNPDLPVTQYSNLGTYYGIDDDLDISEFNNVIQLLRKNQPFNDDISINNGLVTGVYGDYLFDITSTTIVDNGILITNETLTSLGTVTLSNPVFRDSTYTLFLTVYSYENPNIDDDDTTDVDVTVLEIELENDVAVDIPFDTLTASNVVSFDAQIEIKHDKPVINGTWIDHLELDLDHEIIQSGDTLGLTASVMNVHGEPGCGSGVVIEFYEVYEPTSLELSVDKNVIQTNDTATLKAVLKDEDGSLIADEVIEFYEVYEPTTLDLSVDKNVIQTNDTATLKAVLKDEDGSLIADETIEFYIIDDEEE